MAREHVRAIVVAVRQPQTHEHVGSSGRPELATAGCAALRSVVAHACHSGMLSNEGVVEELHSCRPVFRKDQNPTFHVIQPRFYLLKL